MRRTYIGFGFGPIQAGLFVHEARRAGDFDRYVISEIDPALVSALRRSGGSCTLNLARPQSVEPVKVEGVELYDPRVPEDRAVLAAAIAEATHGVTAVGSVGDYARPGAENIPDLLIEGLRRRKRAEPLVLYAAENDNRAAEILGNAFRARAPLGLGERLAPVNTVIRKMCGKITEPAEMAEPGRARLTPQADRALLMEECNEVLVRRPNAGGPGRGLTFLQEKTDLAPFAEAKLYGYNAVHALVAYLGALRGHRTVAEAGRDAPILDAARRAFIDESGAAMIRRHGHTGDPLFTPPGFRAHAGNVLERMVCPHLHDLVERVGRDPRRKLGWDDRLCGAMRLALDAGLDPVALSLGTAGAVLALSRESDGPASPAALTPGHIRRMLRSAWGHDADERAETLIALTTRAMEALRTWPD